MEYRDRNDPLADPKTSAWRKSPVGHKLNEDGSNLCNYPDEHPACVIDPAGLVEANKIQIRTLKDDRPAAIRFYAFVQHEGDVVIMKQHNPHIVVSIGQSFGMSHNFLQPEHVRDLWDEEKGLAARGCVCEDGLLGAERPSMSLSLRDQVGATLPE